MAKEDHLVLVCLYTNEIKIYSEIGHLMCILDGGVSRALMCMRICCIWKCFTMIASQVTW
jgi:hypothetical protein